MKNTSPHCTLNLEEVCHGSSAHIQLWRTSGRPQDSVTRLGDLWKFFATNFATKVPQIFDNFVGFFKKHYFLSKSCCRYFLGNLWKLFIQTSGHTAPGPWNLNEQTILYPCCHDQGRIHRLFSAEHPVRRWRSCRSSLSPWRCCSESWRHLPMMNRLLAPYRIFWKISWNVHWNASLKSHFSRNFCRWLSLYNLIKVL